MIMARKIKGGLGAPDLIKYYYASHLRVLTSWTARKASTRWAEIERSVTAPVHPCYMLWPSSDKHMPQLREYLPGSNAFLRYPYGKDALNVTLYPLHAHH